ncbi:hypothetical protein CBER1_07135 [Cercospora berteroae]|uniref:Uncharacterized protein n=1 Tax=Cercospora berteroae TaxID=357750 RepID=A0A2S6CFS0_9PEZI|nr:hypothetical protein CBER1_07135 [Cercospora berteroae]
MHSSTLFYALGVALVFVPGSYGAVSGDVQVLGATNNGADSHPAEVYDDVHNQLSKRSGFREGFVDFGHDGVARIYACNGTIFDALRLSNQQLMAVARAQGDDIMLEGFEGVSRHDVPEHHLLDPPSEIRLSHPGADEHPNTPLDLCTPPSATDDEDDNDSQRSPNPQSPNPSASAKQHLQPRGRPFCKYKECTKTETCLFMGCGYCAREKKISRLRKIFGTSHKIPGPFGRGTKRNTPEVGWDYVHYHNTPPTKHSPADPKRMRCLT